MNIREEKRVNLFGDDALAKPVIATDKGRIINQKILISKQIKYEGRDATINTKLSFDDDCRNGHEDFSITGDISIKGHRDSEICGCIHEEIAQYFPKLKHLIKWHLMGTDGPMHYIANTVYHASNRDCNGLLKGEKRQIHNRKTGQLCWKLETKGKKLEQYINSETKPLETEEKHYVALCREGEGKERDFDAARRCAIWPEATDEQLSLPENELKALLLERAPALLQAFKADILEVGFVWPTLKAGRNEEQEVIA